MFCPKCGAEMPNGAEFCIKCGTKLPTESTVQQPNTVQADAPKKKKKKKSKLPIIIGAAVLLVVIIIVIAVSSGSGGGRNIDYIATAKAHTPFAASQNLPYTFAEVFDKYTNNLVWYTDSENEKTDTAIVKADGTVKGTEYRLIVGIKVSPNPNDPDGCLIQPQSVDFDGIESASQGNVADFLYIMFAAYDEGFEDLSEVLSNRDEISELLTGSGQQGNTESPGTKPTSTEQILGVKGGTNSAYPGVTYGEAFENFFSDPTWEYFVGTQDGPDEDGDGEPDYTVDNVDVVEFTGGCLYANAEVTALIQFVLDNEAGTFQPVYLSFNGVPQNMLMLSGLLDTVFTQAMEDFGLIAPQTEPPQTAPPQLPQAPLPTDYVGTWVDTTHTYQMIISYDGLFDINISTQDPNGSEWRQWSLEGYGDGGGIFYSGGYADLYLRDDGTVGGGGAFNETDGYMYIAGDWSLYWHDSALGLPEIRFTKQ